MSTIGLRRLRIWLIVISFLMVVMMVACYADYASLSDQYTDGAVLYWQDYCTIAMSIVLFFSYIYALKGKPYLHKFLRAFLMLAVVVFLLYLNVKPIVEEVQDSNSGYYTAFSCSPSDSVCYVCWVYTFLCVITGFFAVFDLFWTLNSGPLQPNNHHYGRHGYGEQANIIVVSPDQQSMYYPQQQQYLMQVQQQQQQQQQFQQQQLYNANQSYSAQYSVPR